MPTDEEREKIATSHPKLAKTVLDLVQVRRFADQVLTEIDGLLSRRLELKAELDKVDERLNQFNVNVTWSDEHRPAEVQQPPAAEVQAVEAPAAEPEPPVVEPAPEPAPPPAVTHAPAAPPEPPVDRGRLQIPPSLRGPAPRLTLDPSPKLSQSSLQELVIRCLPPTTALPVSWAELRIILTRRGYVMNDAGSKRVRNAMKRLLRDGMVLTTTNDGQCYYHRNSSRPVVEAMAFEPPQAAPAPADSPDTDFDVYDEANYDHPTPA